MVSKETVEVRTVVFTSSNLFIRAFIRKAWLERHCRLLTDMTFFSWSWKWLRGGSNFSIEQTGLGENLPKLTWILLIIERSFCFANFWWIRQFRNQSKHLNMLLLLVFFQNRFWRHRFFAVDPGSSLTSSMGTLTLKLNYILLQAIWIYVICVALKKQTKIMNKNIKAKVTQYIILQYAMFLALMVLESVMKCNEMFCFLAEKA